MLLGFVVSTSFTVGATVKQACTDEEGKYLYPRLHRGNGWWLLGVWTVLLLEALPFLGVIP